MAFTEKQEKDVVEKLNAKVTMPCAGCGRTGTRKVVTELFGLQLSTLSPAIMSGLASAMMSGKMNPAIPPVQPFSIPATLPCIVLLCMNCGLTGLYNVHVLGVAEILGIPSGVTHG